MSIRLKIIGIMACDPHGVIGYNNRLPWRYEEELEHFRQVTNNNVVIMGYNTYFSMPSTAFATRQAIILSRHHHVASNKHVTFVSSLADCLKLVEEQQDRKHFMIGGASVAKVFLQQKLISKFLLTKIKQAYNGDVFFPLDLLQGWDCKLIKDCPDFAIYQYEDHNNVCKTN